ncbi:MAG: ABC transporter permease [Steroidobacteraceae bacterium]
MKYWPLIWFGIWRKPGRTVLMFLQVLVAFLLFGVLQGVKSGVDQAVAAIRAELYWVFPADADTTLPLGLEQSIGAVPGVKHVYPNNTFSSTYQNPAQQVSVMATDFDANWVGDVEVRASPDAVAALMHTRTGALVSTLLQDKYHWKVGDQIPLLSRTPQKDGNTTWTFEDVGTFAPPDSGALGHFIVVQNDYFDEARQKERHTVDEYLLEVHDAAQGEQIARRIDALTASSPYPTRTESIRSVNQSNYRSLGDLNFVVHSIVSAALFALLIATAALTMQSVRERAKELAVLKTMGFSDRKIFVLLLLESITLSLGAALIGLVVASRMMLWVNRFLNIRVTMPYAVLAAGLVLALVLALASASPPAWRVLRLRVAEALAGR